MLLLHAVLEHLFMNAVVRVRVEVVVQLLVIACYLRVLLDFGVKKLINFLFEVWSAPYCLDVYLLVASFSLCLDKLAFFAELNIFYSNPPVVTGFFTFFFLSLLTPGGLLAVLLLCASITVCYYIKDPNFT